MIQKQKSAKQNININNNGVKQGGISSPVLFNICMDKLGIALNDTAIGGKTGGQLLNLLCYADDMCLVSISFLGMQTVHTNLFA